MAFLYIPKMIPIPEGSSEKERRKLYEEYIESLKRSIENTCSISLCKLFQKKEQK